MRNHLLAASCLALLAPCAGLAQVQTEPAVRPVPSESRPPPRPAPYRSPPARPGPVHEPPVPPPGMSGPYHPGSVYPGVAVRPEPPPAGPGGIAPHRPVVPATPVPAEPRYGVLRSAPGLTGGGYHQVRPVDRRIGLENQRHWNWNGHRHHGGPYHYPSGHGYRRWRIGQVVPLILLQPEYLFDDYADLGFDDPPPGYEWVRYGPDMLLVDLDTGEVVDVEYGVFD